MLQAVKRQNGAWHHILDATVFGGDELFGLGQRAEDDRKVRVPLARQTFPAGLSFKQVPQNYQKLPRTWDALGRSYLARRPVLANLRAHIPLYKSEGLCVLSSCCLVTTKFIPSINGVTRQQSARAYKAASSAKGTPRWMYTIG